MPLPKPGDKRLLEWRTTFPLSGDVPIIAHRRVRHPNCQAHSHDFMEVVLIVGGTGTQITAAGERRLARGDVIVLRPGGWHGYLDCDELDITNIAFATDLLHRELTWALEDPALSFLLVSGPLATDAHGVLHLHLAENSTRRCERHAEDLCEVSNRPDDRPAGARRAQRLGLLLLVLGDVLEGADIRGFARTSLSGLHPAVAKGMQLLESDIARSWSLDELAEEVGLERSYLIRQFKRGAGMPPMSYLARRRGERAASLLAHTREPVAAIAQQVGWPDPVHFSRRFKAAFGITATEYRIRFAEPATT